MNQKMNINEYKIFTLILHYKINKLYKKIKNSAIKQIKITRNELHSNENFNQKYIEIKIRKI